MSKVLHICSGFATRNIYSKLAVQLNNLGVHQAVYSAVRIKVDLEYFVEKLKGIDVVCNKVLYPWDRVFFRRKINKVFNHLCANVFLDKYKLVHAHFLYSDGAVALKIKKRYGLPYIVVVRNTDLNYFMVFWAEWLHTYTRSTAHSGY